MDRTLHDRVVNDFTYHPPTADQVPVYEEIRTRGREFALFLLDVTPPSRDQSLALTALEEAVFRANAAVARAVPMIARERGDLRE